MSQRLLALGIDQAKSDGSKALLLAAIIDFANHNNLPDLAAEARALMPEAHPFRPPATWREQYDAGFTEVANEDRGVYRDDMPRYGTEFWQALTDQQRQERVENPSLGLADGRADAASLNGA